jgi:predicted outer membrane repeat protein
VYVNNTSPNASDTEQCGSTTSSPCSGLEYVLENRVESSTQVVIASGGNYALNESVTLNNKSSVAIISSDNVSSGEERVTVTCTQGAGLSFVNCFDVQLYGLILLQCSALQESTSRNFSSSGFSFMKFPVALYFLSCQNISLTCVTISESSGTGLAVYATGGQNHFQYCTLTNNGSPDDNTYPSGGGMYIEFPFCSPYHQEECESDKVTISNDFVTTSARYVITQCEFKGNTAHMWHPISYQYLLPQHTNHLSFGSGGGLSVIFSRANDSIATVTECLFQNNKAEWGGGAAIEFQGTSWNNTVVMESCTFLNNTVPTESPTAKVRGGGGLKLTFTSDLDNLTMAHNNMSFNNCTFRNNTGYWGGGILLRAVREQQRAKPTNTIKFHNCSWIGNVGRVGSAMDVAVWGPALVGASLTPTFTDCTFRGNNDIFNFISQLGQPISVGSLYTHSIPLLFESSVVFEHNNRSALAAVNTFVEFGEHCCAIFANNSGRDGGAIALYGLAFVLVHNYTDMTFTGNTADKFGGAIYHSAHGEHNLYLFGFCFIQFIDFMISPWNWTSSFYFSENNAKFKNGGNSIYATSLIPCLWDYVAPNSHSVIPEPNAEVFCWSDGGWDYDRSNCTQEVSSAPGEFSNTSYHMKIVLGRRQRMPITIFEDKGKNQTSNAIFNIWSYSEGVAQVPAEYTYVSDNTISLTGTPGNNTTLAIETINPRVVYYEITVEILPCPPGFITDHTNNSESRCVCSNRFGSVLQCFQGSFMAKLRRGLWMGEDPLKGEVVVGMYPYTKTDLKEVYIELAHNMTALDKQLCGPAHRTGPFCARCKHGYAPSINSLLPHCVRCSKEKCRYQWFLYILAEVVPVTIFFFVIMLFHISVTRGAVNSFVLFAQLVTTTFDITGDGTIPLQTITKSASGLQKAYHVLYNFWNLNFFISVSGDFCLGPRLNTITVLSFHYFLAFYSLALIFVFYGLVRLYEHGVQPFYCLGKPIHRLLQFFRQHWNLSRSTVDAFSTFLVLSSTKFTVVSVYLLTTVTYIYSEGIENGPWLYFQGDVKYLSLDHLPFFLLAVFVMTTFVVLPTLLLLVYPLKLVEWLAARLGYCGRHFRPGHRMNLFLDTFQGCFKDGTNGTRDCRYFAGVYFLLRTILFTTYGYTSIWLQQYLVQQLVCTVAILLFAIIRPYKKDFYNNLDATILGILSMINALSMYNIYYTSQGFSLSSWAFAIQYILIYCPLIYPICYVAWKALRHRKRVVSQFFRKCLGSRHLERQAILSHFASDRNTTVTSLDEEYLQFANEVEAFGRDREKNRYRPMGADSSGSDSDESSKGASMAPYSSASVINHHGNSSGVSCGPYSDL